MSRLLVIAANALSALIPRVGAVHGLNLAVLAPFTARRALPHPALILP